MSVYFQVEANFGKEWQRNGQKHTTLEMAASMAKHFQRMAQVRIVKTTEEIQEEIISLNNTGKAYNGNNEIRNK
jgi:hypothetical protein